MSETTNESVGEQIIKIIDELFQNDNLQASPSVWYGLHQIKQLLSADVAEVVRCKDCIHLEVLNGDAYYARCKWHGILFESFGKADTRIWYCADRERRTE